VSGVGGIFLSYRREDTAPASGRLADLLNERFGEDLVFVDVETIEPGDDFTVRITGAVESCDVLLAMIGPRWLTATDGRGRRRIDLPDDYVALEIGAALRRGIRVIPILVDGAPMVGAADLPPGLRDLATRHAVPLDAASFATDAHALIAALDRVLKTTELRRDRRRRLPGSDPVFVDAPTAELIALVVARSRRRTRLWWAVFILAMVVGETMGGLVMLIPAAGSGSFLTAPLILAGALWWSAHRLRREITDQRLLLAQVPATEDLWQLRRALSRRRVRFLTLTCVAVSVALAAASAFPTSGARTPPAPRATSTAPVVHG
jgi:hypothetical protein